jgi:hypothetical protein
MIKPTGSLHIVGTCAVVIAFAIIGFLSLGDYGMGWDEVTRWNSGDRKVEYYENLLKGEATPAMAGDRYPGLFDMTLSLLHRTFGGDRMLAGHALSMVFGCVGLVATAWMAGLLFGARAAFLSTLFLALYPNFYGHAMINPKDIPFMATYALGLAAILHAGKRRLRTGGSTVGDFLLCGATIGLAAATRLPGLILLPFCLLTFGAVALLHARRQRPEPAMLARQSARLAAGMALTAVVGLVVVAIFYPRLHAGLFSSITQVSGDLHTSASEIPLLFRGVPMTAGDAPHFYAHWMLAVTTPVWMLVLMLAGLAGLVAILRQSPAPPAGDRLMLFLFAAFAAFPWVYVGITAPALHNGIRHMLWGVPPLVVLMAVGFGWLWQMLHRQSPRLSWLAPAALAALAVLQGVHLRAMHPYQYVSFNIMAGNPDTVVNRYEAEYWFTSTRHLLEALPRFTRTPQPGDPVRVRVAGPLNSARPFVPQGFVLVDSFEEAEYFVSNTTFRTDLLADGSVLFELRRGAIPIGVIKQLGETAEAR